MSWRNVVGHEENVARLQTAIRRERLGSTFLFVGPPGVGKRTVARQLAKQLLCEGPLGNTRIRIDSCDDCVSCHQVDASTHPDLLQIQKPANRNQLLLEQFIGDTQNRGRSGLCHDIALKPYRGGRRIAIIDDADDLNTECANCLLKTLEEPPPGSVLILLASGEQTQLPTIRSRCQTVRFDRLATQQLHQVLDSFPELPPECDVSALASVGHGSVEMALRFSDASAFEFRQHWLGQLASLDPAQDRFDKQVAAFVDAAGSDAAVKRDRLRLVADIAIDFYRMALAALHARDVECDGEMRNALEATMSRIGDDRDNRTALAVNIADGLQRCFDVKYQVSANVSQAAIIETWLCDLGRLMRGEVLTVRI